MGQPRSFNHLYFFGRFNFPHVGYLYVLRETLTQIQPTGGLSIVFSAPQATWNKRAIAYTHRKAMFSLALQELPPSLTSQVHLSAVEQQMEKELGDQYTGYTIDTLSYLEQDTSLADCAIIMGADAALGIPEHHAGITAWKDWQTILFKLALIIIPRGRYPDAHSVRSHLPKELVPTLTQGRVIILDTSPSQLELHASSSAIQDGSTHYLPASVFAYGKKHALL